MVKESLLASNEKIIFHAHSHWKNIFVPVVITVVMTALAVFTLLQVAEEDWQRWAVVAITGLVVLVFGFSPIAVWLASTDTLTTRRLIGRSGVFSRQGKDLPIDRVQSVSYRRTLLERILGSGTLVVQTAGETSDIELHDVAHIERRLMQVQELILHDEIPAEGTDHGTGENVLTQDLDSVVTQKLDPGV